MKGVGNGTLHTGLDAQRLRMLSSYWYFKDADMPKELGKHFSAPFPELFADSGAYSAYAMGLSVDIGAYADWLHKWDYLIAAAANLDDKGSWRKSLRNLRYLEDRGLHPIPVWHSGEPLELLSEYIAAYPYIALGGIAGNASIGIAGLRRMLIKVFQMAEGKAVYHGFGITTLRALRDFPWYSVDSTSWLSGARYGQVNMFDRRKGKMVPLGVGKIEQIKTLAPVIRSYGVDPSCFTREKYHRRYNVHVGALSFREAEAYVRGLHGAIQVPAKPGFPTRPDGVRLYLSDSVYANAAYTDGYLKHVAGLPITATLPPPYGYIHDDSLTPQEHLDNRGVSRPTTRPIERDRP